MGWNGGTEIFDVVVEDILFELGDEALENKIIVNLLNVLEGQDWDNVYESEYYEHPRIRAILKERDPALYDDEDE